MNNKIKYITKAGIIAAIYAALMLVQMIPAASLTFGPIQLRIAEGLTLLPLLESAAIPGLFIGCLISNIIAVPFSGLGLIDIFGGSFVTLVAAYLTSKCKKNQLLGILPPVLMNGFIVSIWVSLIYELPYWPTVLSIGGGEALAVLIFGSIFLYAYKKVDKRML